MTEAKRAHAKLLASSGGEGELSSFHKEAFRRSVESMVVVDWRVKDSIDRPDARLLRYKEQREEEIRLWNEAFLARMRERFDPLIKEAEGE